MEGQSQSVFSKLVEAVKRLYQPKYMVKDTLKRGAIPGTKEGFSTAYSTAWAAIAETFLISLIGMADTVTISVLGVKAIAAVSIVNQPRYLAQTVVFALNIAVTSLCARRKGAGDQDGAVDCLKQGIVLSGILSVIVVSIFYPFAGNIIRFMGAEPEIVDISTDYFRILLLGLPIANISHTISSAQRGVGETRASMHINMTANIINIIFDIFLINGLWIFPRLEERGGAISTVLGWSVGLLIGLKALSHKDQFLYMKGHGSWRLQKSTLKPLGQISVGSFFEQTFVRLGFMMNTKVIAGLGTIMFGAHQILMNLMSLSFSFGDGFGIAASSLVGQNLGAKRPDLSIVYGKICQRMSLISSSVLFFVFAFLGKPIVGLLSKNDPAIMSVSETILIIIGFIIFAQSSQMVFMGALRGAGDTKYTAVVSMISIMLLRPISSYVFAFTMGLGLVGAWLGMVLDQFLRLYLTYRRFSSGDWMKIDIK